MCVIVFVFLTYTVQYPNPYITVLLSFFIIYSSALLGPSLDKFEKIRIKVGLVLVAICDKTEYTN